MRVGVVSIRNEVNAEEIRFIQKISGDLGLKVEFCEDIAPIIGIQGVPIKDMDVNFILTIGSDKVILRTLMALPDKTIPIIALHGHGSRSFMAIANIDEFPDVIKYVIRGDYIVERRLRLRVKVDDGGFPPALNEVAILSKVSGGLIRYSLRINNELIWRDEGDGVIIATPTGSTAYALSAGGPIITTDLDVIDIVPINSMIPLHKPIITSAFNTITIENIYPKGYSLIIDGQTRQIIDMDKINIYKAEHDAAFIKIPGKMYSLLDKKLRDRIITAPTTPLMTQLPPSCKLILKILQYEGPLTTKEIIYKSGLPVRTVNYALKILMNRDIIVKRTSSRDARQNIYMIS